jgi:hypothetical protein
MNIDSFFMYMAIFRCKAMYVEKKKNELISYNR